MFKAISPRSRSISSRSTSRNRLSKSQTSEGSDDHSILEEDHKKHNRNDNNIASGIGSLWLLVPLLLLLATHSDRSIVLDNYLPATVYGLFLCGALLISISIGCSWYNARSERGRHLGGERPVRRTHGTRELMFCKAYSPTILLLVSASAARIAIEITLVSFEQCLVPGTEGLLPMLYVAWNTRKWLKEKTPFRSRSTTFEFAGHGQDRYGLQDGQSAILLGLATWTASYVVTYPRSTMICESSLAGRVLSFQFLSVVLDLCIFNSLESCLEGLLKLDIGGQSGWNFLIGALCLICGPLILILSLVLGLGSDFTAFETLRSQELIAFTWESLIFLLTVVLAGPLLSSGRIMTFFSAFVAVFVVFRAASSLGNRDGHFLLDHAQPILALACAAGVFRLNRSSRSKPRERSYASASRSSFISYLIPILITVSSLLVLYPGIHVHFKEHPIDAFILAADQAHEAWAMQAKQSQSLREAVINYEQRYNRQPPPNFHIWYNFAIARNSEIVDDFDNIERDLAPFRTLRPAELRERIKEAVDDSFNEVGIIKIRDGVASVDKRFEGHAWMMEIMVLMMEYFISSLPDMDIPFNINDEPRVVVPYQHMKEVLSRKPPVASIIEARSWSSNTGDLLDQTKYTAGQPPFENWSFRNNFEKYSTLACAPNTSVQQTKSWSPARHCVWCSKPHSRLDFVEDWHLAGNPCHQPDIGTLHGFYQGPGAYKATKKLLPIFSASKPQGYADILYPSIWGWNDEQRLRYAPSKDYPSPKYADKLTTLFWRGSTLEGYATQDKWRTFSRQRFVHMANQGVPSLPVYLPVSKQSRTYGFENLSKQRFLEHSSLKGSGFDLDVEFTAIEKAAEHDFSIQSRVFETVEDDDFQAHWQHKYVISLDEVSASRTFIPFVQSDSLVFRATIFREWFDDRLIAWKHFVPMDLRFRGLWSTLAYFAGGFGTTRSTDGMDAGQYIAESGKLWGSRTLRRDDMEIYLFRLLLEWGRLLDDQRDQLGFQI